MLSNMAFEMTIEIMLKNVICKFISCDRVHSLLILNLTDQKCSLKFWSFTFEFWGLNLKLKYTIYNLYSRQKFLVCYLDSECIHSTIHMCV